MSIHLWWVWWSSSPSSSPYSSHDPWCRAWCTTLILYFSYLNWLDMFSFGSLIHFHMRRESFCLQTTKRKGSVTIWLTAFWSQLMQSESVRVTHHSSFCLSSPYFASCFSLLFLLLPFSPPQTDWLKWEESSVSSFTPLLDTQSTSRQESDRIQWRTQRMKRRNEMRRRRQSKKIDSLGLKKIIIVVFASISPSDTKSGIQYTGLQHWTLMMIWC